LPSSPPPRSRTARRHTTGAAVHSLAGRPGPPDDTHPGIVVRSHGLWHEVAAEDSDAVVIATVRGQLKRQRRSTDIVAVGDRVWITRLPENEAVIEYVSPRTRTLGRTARHTRDVVQVILANPDQVMLVFAVHQPEPHLRMLDRFIILAELQEVPIQLVVTKLDLDGFGGSRCAREVFADYERSFPIHYVSVLTGEGMDGLGRALAGRVSAVAGPSGVGKSSLLNFLDPGNKRDTSEVSLATGKGRHTTVGARLHPLGNGTFVADTPGIRALAMVSVAAEDLDWSFRELRPYLGQCFYQDCSHVHEPDCAVREAVAQGEIPAGRYQSFLALRQGDEIDNTPVR